ncbi:unnamed protein product [Vicia faba]|uniref:Uncharacterized protein n=1 Tax=Vicia faba TaxID=3906 RepID=A0AAV0ZNE5_VICFA|nr:unnamed protein product [Vicia faba]
MYCGNYCQTAVLPHSLTTTYGMVPWRPSGGDSITELRLIFVPWFVGIHFSAKCSKCTPNLLIIAVENDSQSSSQSSWHQDRNQISATPPILMTAHCSLFDEWIFSSSSKNLPALMIRPMESSFPYKFWQLLICEHIE